MSGSDSDSSDAAAPRSAAAKRRRTAKGSSAGSGSEGSEAGAETQADRDFVDRDGDISHTRHTQRPHPQRSRSTRSHTTRHALNRGVRLSHLTTAPPHRVRHSPFASRSAVLFHCRAVLPAAPSRSLYGTLTRRGNCGVWCACVRAGWPFFVAHDPDLLAEFDQPQHFDKSQEAEEAEDRGPVDEDEALFDRVLKVGKASPRVHRGVEQSLHALGVRVLSVPMRAASM